MASADLRHELTCSVCLSIYTDPVTLPCGHSFCRPCIANVLDIQDAYKCPECRAEFQERSALEKNRKLRNIAESFRSIHPEPEEAGILCTYCILSPVPAAKTCLHCEASLCENHLRVHSKSAEHVLTEPTTSVENRKCSVHKKVLEYYCCDDAAYICVYCSATEHKGHQVKTLNEVSQKKKDILKHILQKLSSKREEAEKTVQSLQELRSKVQVKATGLAERVTALIRDIREHLETLEKQVLSEISRQEEQVSLRVSDLIRQLEIKKEDLSRKMGNIEELCNMTDPVTVLQGRESDGAHYCDAEERDNEDTERHDIKVQDAGDLDVGLISATLHSGLAGIVTTVMRQHRVPETSDTLLGADTASDTLLGADTASDTLLGADTASDILLDVNTASNDVSVSGDLKTMTKSEINLRRSKTPLRFQDYNQVLSSRSFSSGRHYWEVEGSETGEWMVGMSYPSIDRRGDQSQIGYNNKSWCLGRWDNKMFYVKHDNNEIRLPHRASCRRLGIFLDYEVGCLSFYELGDPIRHLHTFNSAFTEPLHAVFGMFWRNTWLKV